jgi:hypothetical protein
MIAELVDIGVLWRDGDQVINLAVTVPNQ